MLWLRRLAGAQRRSVFEAIITAIYEACLRRALKLIAP